MSDYKTELKKMLRNVRLSCGLSQNRVAAVLGIHRATYTCYESGRSTPNIVTLQELAALFAIPVEAFLHPEEYSGLDTEHIRIRSRKYPHPVPQRMADLTREEIALVLEHRYKNLEK